MTSPVSAPPTRLVARTRPVPPIDPLAHAGADAFVWLAPGHEIVATGVAARPTLDEVEDVLGTVEVHDEVGRPGTGVLACGALPFALDAGDRLVVPRRVFGRDADGSSWVTEIDVPGAPQVPEPVPTGMPARTGAAAPTVRAGMGRERWEEAVRRVLAAVDDAAVAKVVLARDVIVEAAEPFRPQLVAARLRADAPGCYVFADPGIVGATPELLVARRGASAVAQPMAGTAYGDEAAVDALIASRKDGAEHRCVVDAVASVLGAHGVVAPSVRGPVAERFGALAHLATTVEVALDPATAPSALALARELHPTPAVAGTPVATARALIAALEPNDRGRYAGPVGWVDASGEGEWAIALRCAQLAGNRAVLHAGAGIVAGSEPAAEWAETEAKLVPMLAALGVVPSTPAR